MNETTEVRTEREIGLWCAKDKKRRERVEKRVAGWSTVSKAEHRSGSIRMEERPAWARVNRKKGRFS